MVGVEVPKNIEGKLILYFKGKCDQRLFTSVACLCTRLVWHPVVDLSNSFSTTGSPRPSWNLVYQDK